MTTRNRAFSLLLCAVLLTAGRANAQQAEPKLVDAMLDCTMHEEAGPWVPEQLRPNGLLRFNYLHEMPTSKDPQDPNGWERLYAAFWNTSKNNGEFLHFTISHSGPTIWLTVTNAGHISYARRELNLDFFQGGVATEAEYMKRVRRLAAEPVRIVTVGDVKRTGVLCDSVANPHPEWDKGPPHR